jgi:alkanesulfonate monooxygenase SsuD/methylene tetrahydromethanopterin reductase-like flavin-dependent oxidoreductase (luciferase family)
VDYGSRGTAVAEAVPVIRAAFDDEYPTVGGPGAEVGIGIAPRPVRPGGPPIWIGGSSKAAIRRAALLGDGWLPQGPPPMGTSAAVAFIREERLAAGLAEEFDFGVNAGIVYVGDPDFDVEPHTITGSPEQIVEVLDRFVGRGFNQLQLRFIGRSVNEVAEQLEAFGNRVAPLLPGNST